METAEEVKNRVMENSPVSSVDSVATNNENENVSNSSNKLSTSKMSPDKRVNSSLNPNAIPFYPLQQLQNFNINHFTNVIDVNANVGHILNANPVNLNNMPVFHQAPGQILVLTLPTGLPIHNHSGIQMPQMIIPLQIPVPAPVSTSDQNYHMAQSMILNGSSTATSSECTTPASDSVHSDPLSVEDPRYASPMMVDVLPSPEVKESSVPSLERIINNVSVEPGLQLPAECYVEDQTISVKGNLISVPSNTPTSDASRISDVVPVPQYKVSSPSKMNIQSRNDKAALAMEEQPSGENTKVSIETKGSKRKAKGQKTKPQLQTAERSKLAEIEVKIESLKENLTDIALEKSGNSSEVTKMNAKNTEKLKKVPKARKGNVKEEFLEVNLLIKQEPQIIETKENVVQTNTTCEGEEIDRVTVKVEPVENICIKNEPENNVQFKLETSSNIMSLTDEDGESPELFTTGGNVKMEVQNPPQCQQSIPQPACASEEQILFNQEVNNFSETQVNCVKRQTIRNGTCSAEYALSGNPIADFAKKQSLKKS